MGKTSRQQSGKKKRRKRKVKRIGRGKRR